MRKLRTTDAQGLQSEEIAMRSDFVDIIRCLNDENILDHLARKGWYRVAKGDR